MLNGPCHSGLKATMMSVLHLVITLHLLLLPDVMAAPTSRSSTSRQKRRSPADVRISVRSRHHSSREAPPSFMTGLYEQLADRHGQPKRHVANALATHSAAIWSFENSAPSRLAISPSLSIVTELEFNVQHLPKNAGILFAQLRLFNFVEGIRARERRKTCIITVSEKLANGEEIPIATKETTASRSGWEILNVTHLIEQRRQGIDVRLLVRVRGPFGKVNSYTPSEQKRYIDRMQSLLVVYVQPPSGNSHHHQVSVDDEIWQQLQLDFKQLDEQDQDSIVLSRHERAVDKDRDNGISGDETTEPQMCSLKKLKVRFSDLDMETVLQPKSFLMNECVGTCVGKFLQSFRDEGKALTNHAVMKALLAQKTQTPHRICCVPDDKDMGYIMLLLKHANGSMALQRSEKMIANSCGCR